MSGRITINRSSSFFGSLLIASWNFAFNTLSTWSGRALTGGSTGSGLNCYTQKRQHLGCRNHSSKNGYNLIQAKVILLPYHSRYHAHLCKFRTETVSHAILHIPCKVHTYPVVDYSPIDHFLKQEPINFSNIEPQQLNKRRSTKFLL